MTLTRKKKPCKACGGLQYIFSKGRCRRCASKDYKSKKRKKPEKKKLNEQLTKIFHLWIRLSNTDEDGMVYCFTSGVRYHYKDLDAGHFVSGTKINTRWDKRNVFPQSVTDNRFRGGRQKEYERRLTEIYGEEWVQKLKEDSKKIVVPTEIKLKKLIKKYQELVDKFIPCSYIGKQFGNAFVMWKDPTNIRKRICLVDGKYQSLTINQLCRRTKNTLKKRMS